MLLEAALNYARCGWRVLPLHHVEPNGSWCSCGNVDCRRGAKNEKSIGKHPRTGHWQHDATTNEEQIVAWWRQWPRANVGIATGVESGVIVLDVDIHRDAPGYESLDILETYLGKLPPTRTAATGSGGQHRLFKYPKDLVICNSAGWRGAAGIDWRADGGQIVASPSIALAGQYKWTDLADVAELPAAWLEAHREYEASRGVKKRLTVRVGARGPIAPPTEAELAEDDSIISKMNAAANAEKFRTLWAGKWNEAGYESQSNADLALCSMISFWCDPDAPAPNPDRIDRLFRRSGLNRDKWDREDYREHTLAMSVELDQNRRAQDAAIREHVLGIGSKPEPVAPLIVVPAAPSVPGMPDAPAAPPIPMPLGVNNADVLAKVRQIIRKKRNSKSPLAKLDGDMIENFMAGEAIISAAEVARTPALAKYQGDDGLHRVSWILGNTLPADMPWDAVMNARPRSIRVMQSPDAMLKAATTFTESQVGRIKWDLEQAEKQRAEKEARDREFDAYCMSKVAK